MAAPGIRGIDAVLASVLTGTVQAAPRAVRDRDPQAARDARPGDDQRRPAVLEGVCEQVVERLRHPHGIADDERRPGVPVEPDSSCGVRGGAPALERCVQQLPAGDLPGVGAAPVLDFAVELGQGAAGKLQQAAPGRAGPRRLSGNAFAVEQRERLQRPTELVHALGSACADAAARSSAYPSTSR